MMHSSFISISVGQELRLDHGPLSIQNKPFTTNELLLAVPYERKQESLEGAITGQFSFAQWTVEESPGVSNAGNATLESGVEEFDTSGLGNPSMQSNVNPTDLYELEDVFAEPAGKAGSRILPDQDLPSAVDANIYMPLHCSSVDHLEVEEHGDLSFCSQILFLNDDKDLNENANSHNASNTEQIEIEGPTGLNEGPSAASSDEAVPSLGPLLRCTSSSAVGKARAEVENVNDVNEHDTANRTSDQRSKRADVAKKRKVSTVKAGSKRKRTKEKLYFAEQYTLLEPYILQERRKCEISGLPCPKDWLNEAGTIEHVARLGLDKYTYLIKIFNYTIANCESVVVLKDVLRAYRTPLGSGLTEIMQEISNAQRLESIGSLRGSTAYLNLIRLCHIHKLFTENSDSQREANGAFIINTAQDIVPHAKRQRGNPLNNAEARITKLIMQEVHPELEERSAGYSSKYNEISDLRRLGRRLHILVEAWGSGILALLPLCKKTSKEGLAANITDSMQVSPKCLSSAGLTSLEDFMRSR